jgi:putative tricarboxylic transport membrane protein
MLLSILFSLLLGMCFGIFTGLIPGFGVLAALLVSLPLLKIFNPLELILFYAAMMCTVQYIGSVVAIYLGIPGENTSLIASKFGHRVYKKNPKFGQALVTATAFSSLFASVIGLLLIFLFLLLSSYVLWLFGIKTQVITLSIVLLVLLFYQKQNVSINLLQIILGLFLGLLGANTIQSFSITFGQSWLLPGLNDMLVILIIFVLPNIIRYWHTNKNFLPISSIVPWKGGLAMICRSKGSMLRGSVVGSVSGLIPGIGTSISSQLSYFFESKFSRSNIARIISAESANNSAVLTSLIPLLLFGLPILASEALILDLLSFKGVGVGSFWMQQKDVLGWSRIELFFLAILFVNVLICFIACVMAAPMAKLYQKIPNKIMIVFLIIVLFFVAILQTVNRLSVITDIITFFILMPLSILLMRKKIDTLPLIFSYMMAGTISKIVATVISFF